MPTSGGNSWFLYLPIFFVLTNAYACTKVGFLVSDNVLGLNVDEIFSERICANSLSQNVLNFENRLTNIYIYLSRDILYTKLMEVR